MITSQKRGFKRNYAYGGAGIFDTLANFLTRLFTSSAAQQIASSAVDVGKSVAKEGAKKALEVGKSEENVNQYLKENDIPKVTILYGNRIYPKMRKNFSAEKLKNIKLKGVFVNDENKSFPQLWLEY